MKKNTKTRNIIFALAAIMIGLSFAGSASAEADCTIVAKKGETINLNAVAECMEDRYGYDKDMLRRSKKKEATPTVEIHFDKTNPKEGEKVTAIAVVKHFKTDSENLYFTWYLRHTNAAGNFTNTVSAGKREAMGIIARGAFDPCLFGIDQGCDGTYNVEDSDNDGFFAPYGGQDGVGAKDDGWGTGRYDDTDSVLFDIPKQILYTDAITRCYDHNFGLKLGASEDEDAGRDRIAVCEHKFAVCDDAFETGDGEFGLEEEECWKTDPTNPDTDGDGIRDEADVAGLAQQQFVWTYREGDQVGVVVEGTSSVPIIEGGFEYEYYADCAWSVDVGGDIQYFDTQSEALAACEELLSDSVTSDGTVDTTSTTDPVTEITTDTGTTTSTTDLTDINAGMADYDVCMESIERVCVNVDPNEEDDAVDSDGATNAYYKIMWAMPEFNEKGFYYHATVPIDEKGREILDPELEFIPKNPQYESARQEHSDIISVSAGINNDEVDEDFLYYTWRILKCDANDFFTCEEDMTDLVEWESFQDGLGVKQIEFLPTGDIFGDDLKVWLKAVVVVSRHEDYVGDSVLDPDQNFFPIGAIAEIMIPVARNDMSIQLFRTVNNGGVWTLGEEICTAVPYRDICPVYPFEVLAARVVAPTGGASNLYAWQINNQQLAPPIDCVFSEGCDQYGSVVFFPVFGAGKSIGTISVTAKRATHDLISERMFSVYNPTGVLAPESGNLQPTTRFDGTPAEYTYEAPAGSAVSFRVESLIPNYIGFDEVNIRWIINGEQVYDGTVLNAGFIANNPQLNLSVSGDSRTITFVNDGTWGQGIEVATRIEKIFTDEEQQLLIDAWRIRDSHSLTQDTNVTVKVAFDIAPFGAAPLGSGTLQQFLASSLSNTPQYLVFILRLAVALVLVWSVLFGLSYAVRLNE